MTRNQKYWATRTIKQREALLDHAIEDAYKELQKIYKETANNLIAKLDNIYAEMSLVGQENVLHSHQYSYQKYYEQLEDIKKQLIKLGTYEQEIMEKDFTKYYINNSNLIGEQYGISNHVDPDRAKQIVNQIWCTDGKSFSDRIWKDKQELLNKIETHLSRIMMTGVGRGEMVKDLVNLQSKNYLPPKKTMSKDFKEFIATSFYNARRVAVTELSRLYNTSTIEKYREAGISEYQILAERDNRTCPECLALDGKRFPITDMINRPPFHPNCRCALLGVVDNIVYNPRKDKEDK